MIAPYQMRGARAMLEMSREKLAEAAQVSVRTIATFEAGRRKPIPATMHAIRSALESAGIVFFEENGDGLGVRLRDGEAWRTTPPELPERQ
jgi:DNA-binding XRE family transcriptional regulator